MARSGVLLAAAVLALASSGSSSGGSSSVTAIAAGGNHTCAVTSESGVECWGLNVNGQLGDGTTTSRLTPAAVSGLSSDVRAIAVHDAHSCALTSHGGAECWGYNGSGELGDGTTTERDTPVPVSGRQSGVQAIAAGEDHTCALLNGGGVECWGRNTYGELGDGTTDDRLTPVPVYGLESGVQAISAGEINTCALTNAGRVECWGAGPLGDGTTSDSAFPVVVSGLSSGVRAIAAGGTQTCALTSGGGVKCWGYNDSGELGDGTRTQRNRPVNVSGLSNGVQAIAAGEIHTCALLSDGGVKCWGDNYFGQLGDGTTTNRSRPVAVSGLAGGVQAITAGAVHTCALLSDGGFRCWGSNHYGQLGNGKKTNELDVKVRGHGTVTAPGLRCVSKCSTERDPGTKIVLSERPAKGWSFKGWSGACKGKGRRCTIVLATDKTAGARFAKRR